MVTAKFNIRFNTNHRSDDLIGWLEEHFERVGGPWHATWRTSAQPFVTPFGTLTDLVLAAVETVTGQKPALSTSGGTSDARFITTICPVVEFGLVGKTMHQIDEHVHVADIDKLAKVYHEMLVQFLRMVPNGTNAQLVSIGINWDGSRNLDGSFWSQARDWQL